MRSVDADDYQRIPRDVAVMEKGFPSGARTGWHSHPRAQVLFASRGLMFARTAVGAWAVPKDHALLIPAGQPHEVAMHGTVVMRTAYLVSGASTAFADGTCRVIEVSRLLAAALGALADEPMVYDDRGRGRHLSALVLDELDRAPDAPLALPMARDPRLRRICQALLDRPQDAAGLDAWADEVAMSRRSLTRWFRAETGFSFVAWRTRARLLRALALEAEGVSAPRAANLVGFRKAQSLKTAARRSEAR